MSKFGHVHPTSRELTPLIASADVSGVTRAGRRLISEPLGRDAVCRLARHEVPVQTGSYQIHTTVQIQLLTCTPRRKASALNFSLKTPRSINSWSEFESDTFRFEDNALTT
ncbi:hypothetical protein EVAR_25579_1 [Eumeta japonica]|uniref:Uncharacterized protein n=1 Tax=Eumeta variegata TaxID=151549 RepID=A0A4C1V246_EUMVA|nr:hypothetical protein EVAR_25579_1 [Eumeta japonica]